MIVGRQQLGLDIFGINVDVDKALSQTGSYLQSNILGQVAQAPVVQQAGIQAGQQAAATGFAESFLKNPTPWIAGAVSILAAVYILGRAR